MPTRARLSQERSRERKAALLDAAIDLFAESGARAVTHRAVAARAGLPTASTTYYFASIDDLVREALTRHLENWIGELEELTAAAASLRTTPAQPVDLITQILSSRPTGLVSTQLSILIAAARDPQLRPTMARMLESLEQVAASVLAGVGVRRPDRIATSAVALVAGHALDRLSERHSTREEATLLFRSLRALIVADLLDSDERDAILSRLQAEGTAG